uniref:SAC domain-containing protein n=1 Tax=Rhabditophanes sp. KR3021 TaxID=114890 RepID=A0AC35TPX9_9BILA
MNTYERLNLYTSPDKFYFEARDRVGSIVDSKYLEIDRFNGQLSLKDLNNAPIPIEQVTLAACYGLFGIFPSDYGSLLVTIKRAETIGMLNGSEIYKITEVDVVPFNKRSTGSTEFDVIRQIIEMIQYVVANGSFYYSNNFDLTKSMQWLGENSTPEFRQTSMLQRADTRFTWNRFMGTDFLKNSEMGQFISPVIQGFVGIRHCNVNDHTFKLILISRRSVKRAGVRFYKRGVDGSGNPANYVETEQIVEYDPYGNSMKRIFTAFVQMRGSIPLYWSQKPNLKWAPPLSVNPADDQLEAYLAHMKSQQFFYRGKHSIINLVNQKGKELKVGGELDRIVRQANLQFVTYHGFDFHKECHGLDWSRLSVLKNSLTKDINEAGYFNVQETNIAKYQNGYFRTNCMDCLDRTNVVQSLIALETLNIQLLDLGIVQDSFDLSRNDDFNDIFKNIWADNGDECSRQYAGTGALKADFTRVGKRTIQGALNDGVNAISRYFRNNFTDGYKQDSIDLFLGNAVLSNDAVPKLLTDPIVNVSSFNGAAILGFIFSLAMTILCILVSENLTATLFWFVFTLCLFFFIYLNGEDFVNKPKLKQE